MRKSDPSLPGSLIAAVVLAAIVVAPSPATADARSGAAADRGLSLAREIDRRANEGYGDVDVEVIMVLADARGRESIRHLRVRSLEQVDDGDKTLTVFDRPRDIKDTALLTFTHKVRSNDQWLFLPALKRVKRISTANQSGPFMGSEFAFEDFSAQEVEKFTYRYIGEDEVAGVPVHVLERYPVDRNSGYSRQVVWADKETLRVLRVDYYDRKEAFLKTLTNSDFSLYLGRYWRPGKSLMTNHLTGKKTKLTWSGYRFRTGLGERDFTRASLARAR